MDKKIRPKIKQITKIRSILQQEINSSCPICDSKDVGYFEIHHIDENPQNNELRNLFLLCPTCHSKITKGDISQSEIEKLKDKLIDKQFVECASITIDSENCSWKIYDNNPNAFIDQISDKSPFPILNFSLINQSSRTILFCGIRLEIKQLHGGLSGIPEPCILKSIAKYQIQIPKV